ncbi:MAG: nucleotide sugar dehydrogenase, partial [Bdellovibrionota bacterium]
MNFHRVFFILPKMGQVRTVNVVGLGYVGTASCLHIASQGARVHGWDTSRERVAGLRSGALPFHEPDLLEQHSRLAPGAMSFVEEAANLPRADLWVICVGTPADPRTGLLDTRDVVQALRTVLENCMAREDFHPLLLLRSTVPPLTYRNELRPLVEEFSSTHARFKPRFFYFPEFMREGSALADCRDPALAVLGSDTGFEGVETIRAVFGLESREIDQTSVAVAEMIKISSNAFHTLKVTFANEIASLSHSLGCDGEEVMRLFVKDRKLNISPSYLRPGFAYGGPCLAKDLSHLHRAAGVQGLELPVLGAIQGSNQKHLMRAR